MTFSRQLILEVIYSPPFPSRPSRHSNCLCQRKAGRSSHESQAKPHPKELYRSLQSKVSPTSCQQGLLVSSYMPVSCQSHALRSFTTTVACLRISTLLLNFNF